MDRTEHGAWLTFAEVEAMVRTDRDALVLLTYLRAKSTPRRHFAL
jgi:hypothetical protein